MCIGIPMQVIEARGTFAVCEADEKQELVDMVLVGEQPVGTWILNFLGGAREVLTDENARQIRQALLAIDSVMSGTTEIDQFFNDLVNREPELPPHLQAQVEAQQPSKGIK